MTYIVLKASDNYGFKEKSVLSFLYNSKEELVTRIYKYFDEINETPVIYHLTWHLDDIDPSESVVTETFSKSAVN